MVPFLFLDIGKTELGMDLLMELPTTQVTIRIAEFCPDGVMIFIAVERA
jgi:hypothetical protein